MKAPPKTRCSDIHSGIIVSHCWPVSYNLARQRGSTWTSCHASLIKQAVKSCNQENTMRAAKGMGQGKIFLPHTQCSGNNDSVKPHRKQIAPKNSREKPYCSGGTGRSPLLLNSPVQRWKTIRVGWLQLGGQIIFFERLVRDHSDDGWPMYTTELWATTRSTKCPEKLILFFIGADMGLHIPRPPRHTG